jgi:uncharacterized protein (UPF0548 family)
VFRLIRTSEEDKRTLQATARIAPVSSRDLLSLNDGLPSSKLLIGYAHDRSQSELGQGREIFEAARDAFLSWQQFDLGWARVLDPGAAIAAGQLVGVEVHTIGLWSVVFNRIVDTVDSPNRFGFLYSTTAQHIEQGQERFVIEFDPETEAVSYLIEAVSRPRHLLARLGYPFTRAMQHRFARNSHARLRRGVDRCS